ncbi:MULTISPECIES: type II secretion system F family protein [Hydrocarboniphaga]|jgi:type IV pilus assembly protein PilC|uniref:Type IV pilin biogenesis protein PilC n=1 Tax=Hydrocarboniphaga effusa AP103 TaxID=1172194 RepID=I8TEN5_9GAMM|nr:MULTISPECIES: type II secretion system F family protein [Hydrocarboniphaga]EIT72183.1 type IV pilin biogenesis protein PilC [Hydrocarboniphaga effusa AP103]MDZ4079680.1 type II secretion system F family protein [Hydrocarboniphaga sp.]
MAQALTVKEHTFLWEGLDRKGAKVRGESRGPSESMIKTQLRKQGINPTKVRKKLELFGNRKKIKSGDIAIFSRQMATMMAAGVPLVQSLELIGRGHQNPAMAELIMGVKTSIEGGSSFAESLGKFPLHFDDLFVNLVDAGERSGTLETLLDKVATYKEKTEAIKKKVKKAMTYPSAVLVVAFIVTGILLYFVVPQFEDLFKGFGADLPAFTMMVISLSRFVQDQWLFILGVVGGSIYAFFYFHKRSPKMRRFLDRALLRVPVVGDILYKSAVARYARTLSTMFAAGVPLVEALDSVARASGNIVFQDAILTMKDQVSTGQQLQLTMQQSSMFPSMATQMVAIGEESGSLDEMCAKVADFYEAEVDNQVDSLSSLLEPMIMVILGVLVGGLVVAMYLPIFKLGMVV